jgi:hypothetical protein
MPVLTTERDMALTGFCEHLQRQSATQHRRVAVATVSIVDRTLGFKRRLAGRQMDATAVNEPTSTRGAGGRPAPTALLDHPGTGQSGPEAAKANSGG